MSDMHEALEGLRRILDAREGEALIDAAARVMIEREKAQLALKQISAIRDSIIGAQTVNWSWHIYPLVIALEDAGVAGIGFVEARAQVAAEIERRRHSVHLTPVQLAALLKDIGEWSSIGEDETMYGSFHGGDPRDFTPDEDSSTEEERAAWKADCARWNASPQPPEPGPHRAIVDADGKYAGHLTLCGYGLGVNRRRVPQAVTEALAALRAAHERNENEGNK